MPGDTWHHTLLIHSFSKHLLGTSYSAKQTCYNIFSIKWNEVKWKMVFCREIGKQIIAIKFKCCVGGICRVPWWSKGKINSSSPGWGKGTDIRDGSGQRRLQKREDWIWDLKTMWAFTTWRVGGGAEAGQENKEQAYMIQSFKMSSSLQLWQN